ncbi:hypothetical protein NUSPORA_02251 [Nucleospora cyclopteri]
MVNFFIIKKKIKKLMCINKINFNNFNIEFFIQKKYKLNIFLKDQEQFKKSIFQKIEILFET